MVELPKDYLFNGLWTSRELESCFFWGGAGVRVDGCSPATAAFPGMWIFVLKVLGESFLNTGVIIIIWHQQHVSIKFDATPPKKIGPISWSL